MSYFTTWDLNVFLCLLSWGIPVDLIEEWVCYIRREDRKFCLERDRTFHLRRELPSWRWVSKIGPYSNLLTEYKKKIKEIDPEDR